MSAVRDRFEMGRSAEDQEKRRLELFMDKHNLKILAIDDNLDNLAALNAVIGRALPGAVAFAAADGVKGLELALAEDPDVILLDIVMPEPDGFEVCRRLKADGRLKNIPVVFITAGKTDKENRIKVLEVGGEGFLLKPFEIEELVAQIRAMAKIKAANVAQSRENLELEKMVAERTMALGQELAERKQMEFALRESEEKYRTLLEKANEAIAIAQDGIFAYANRRIADLLLIPAEELCGKPFLNFIWPGDRELVAENYRKRISGEPVPDNYDFRVIGAGGRLIWVSLSTAAIQWNGKPATLNMITDITERKLAGEALREAFDMSNVLNTMLQRSLLNTSLREKLQDHLANLFALPWLAVQPKGAVFLMNPRGNALVLTAQQGLDGALLDACADVPLGRCLCGKAAETGQVVESAAVGAEHHTTYAGMTPHGHYCAPISAGGRTLGVLTLYLKEGASVTNSQKLFIRSVTDLMAENILHSQTEEKLAQSQRMESVGRLAGGVAHDFNNILTAIKCYAEFIRKALDPQDPKLDDVREILTASDRAVALTRQLLAFSRRQIMAPKAVDLNKCVADVTNMLRRLIGEDMTLTTKLAAAPCLAMLDTGQIEQVLVNLVVNARDAMPGGGVIELSTELFLQPPEELFLTHPDLPRGPIVCLKVSDSGTGMTAEVRRHLFEPFFTTKEQGKGTGLGLPTVFGIVKQSGGDIDVESEPGKGSLFRVCFPYCEPGAGQPGPGGAEPAVGEIKGRETILLVEDEESLRRLGKRVLESSGYTVITAAGGPGALKELERRGKPVDLLVTDVVMPGMSGRELAREIARQGLAGRTLYMSGYTDDAIVQHGVLEPGLSFIYKPFTVDGLLAKVRTVLDAPAGQSRA